MRSARRDARAAAETLLGVRASLNAVASIVGPPDPEGFVDMASLSLFTGLERLRPGPAWPIFRWSYINREGRGASPQRAAIESGPLPPLVTRLSPPALPPADCSGCPDAGVADSTPTSSPVDGRPGPPPMRGSRGGLPFPVDDEAPCGR